MVNANKIVRQRCKLLTNSDKKFKDIFEIMFIDKNNTLAESNDGYRIFKTTYNEAYIKIHNLAYSLNNKYPNIKDQYIGISLDSSVEWIEVFWAILASGNKPYLINLRHPKTLTDSILNTLGVKYVIGNDYGYNAELIKLDDLSLEAPSDYKYDFADEIALSTSATTMKEKIVFYNGNEISAQIFNCKAILKKNMRIKKFYHGELKLLAFLPLYHIFGLMAMYLWFSFFGRTFVFLNDYQADTILKTIRKHEVTHIFAVPLFWTSIEREINRQVKEKGAEKKFNKGIKLALKLQSLNCSLGIKLSQILLKEVNKNLFGPSVRFCITGGGAIKDSTLRLINALGYPLYNGYGMTEIGITSVELDNYSRLMNSIGFPFPSVEYKTVDGELYVKGDSISHKMMIDGKLEIVDGYFKTNDIVSFDKGGRYFVYGRKDDIFINETGENINPDLVEKLLNLDFLTNYSVLTYHNKLVLIAQIKEFTTKAQFESINENINRELSKLPMQYTVSKYYFTYDDLMASTAIKVSRKYVLHHIENNDIKLIEPESIKEEIKNVDDKILNIVKDIIKDVLNISEVNDNDNFFYDLGASSLDYFALVNELNNKFNISIPFEDNASKISAINLAAYIEELL